MATLNVFELTNAELSKSLDKTVTQKKVKESVKKTPKTRRKRALEKISANKIRVESLRFAEEADNDTEMDYTPEDDVVLVIDPEMDETPETPEDAEAAAEELVGDYVCKCSVCGANYVCDDDTVNENLESEEGECPVCGETGEQILVGEITPSEDEDVAEDDMSNEEPADEDSLEDDEFMDDSDFEDDSNDDYEESISRARRRTQMRRESAKSRNKQRNSSTTYDLDEVTLNRMLTKFAKENYDNVRFVKITNAKCRGRRLTLEGTVVTKKGSRRTTKFVCENFRPTQNIHAKFVEQGAFTENAISSGTSFVVDFKTNKKVITPVALKYSYKVKERRNVYQVSGKVLSESAKGRRSR